MTMRDMVITAEKVKRVFDENGLIGYDMTIGEVKQLMNICKNGTWDDMFTAVMTAFRYGLALGHRATVAGKIKRRL